MHPYCHLLSKSEPRQGQPLDIPGAYGPLLPPSNFTKLLLAQESSHPIPPGNTEGLNPTQSSPRPTHERALGCNKGSPSRFIKPAHVTGPTTRNQGLAVAPAPSLRGRHCARVHEVRAVLSPGGSEEFRGSQHPALRGARSQPHRCRVRSEFPACGHREREHGV